MYSLRIFQGFNKPHVGSRAWKSYGLSVKFWNFEWPLRRKLRRQTYVTQSPAGDALSINGNIGKAGDTGLKPVKWKAPLS